MLYHSIIPTRKTYEKSSLYVHEKMSNVTQNMDDFWPCVMYVTQDRNFFLPLNCDLCIL